MPKKDKSKYNSEKQGWTLATITGGAHLKRTLDMYRELRIETCLEEISPEKCGECTECYISVKEKMYRIYTKPLEY